LGSTAPLPCLARGVVPCRFSASTPSVLTVMSKPLLRRLSIPTTQLRLKPPPHSCAPSGQLKSGRGHASWAGVRMFPSAIVGMQPGMAVRFLFNCGFLPAWVGTCSASPFDAAFEAERQRLGPTFLCGPQARLGLGSDSPAPLPVTAFSSVAVTFCTAGGRSPAVHRGRAGAGVRPRRLC
jgi:hypothetical protein